MKESFKIVCDMIKNQSITYEQAWELVKDIINNDDNCETNRWWENPTPQAWCSTPSWRIDDDEEDV